MDPTLLMVLAISAMLLVKLALGLYLPTVAVVPKTSHYHQLDIVHRFVAQENIKPTEYATIVIQIVNLAYPLLFAMFARLQQF